MQGFGGGDGFGERVGRDDFFVDGERQDQGLRGEAFGFLAERLEITGDLRCPSIRPEYRVAALDIGLHIGTAEVAQHRGHVFHRQQLVAADVDAA